MFSVKHILFITLMAASGSLVAASAATASTEAAQTISSVTSSGFDFAALIQAAIPLLTAGGISLIKYFIPKLPKTILPFLTPIFGAGVEILAHLTGLSEASPLRGALLGACGVFVHEALTQSKKILTDDETKEIN